ncbi:MAG: SEC-C metal-binding domain-containing protein [Proteobacteria bacterium]|nr:SEC-C metal-binding domain-containing protein [Pseudomonadota bacterium]
MTKIGRNDPCPCGSGKKYKRCCMAKDDAAARSVADPLEAFRAELEAKLATADLPGLQAAQAIVSSVATSHNAGGIAEFHGLSPADMHTLLTRPFDSAAVVQWPQLTGEPSAPVVTLARLLFDGIGDGIRATAKGNLPQKLVMTTAAEFAATVGSDVIEDYGASRRED